MLEGSTSGIQVLSMPVCVSQTLAAKVHKETGFLKGCIYVRVCARCRQKCNTERSCEGNVVL